MAKVLLRPEILGISGRVGNMIFKTHGDKVYLHSAARQPRSTPVTPEEIARRNRFRAMAQEVSRRIAAGDHRPRKLIWADVKQSFA